MSNKFSILNNDEDDINTDIDNKITPEINTSTNESVSSNITINEQKTNNKSFKEFPVNIPIENSWVQISKTKSKDNKSSSNTIVEQSKINPEKSFRTNPPYINTYAKTNPYAKTTPYTNTKTTPYTNTNTYTNANKPVADTQQIQKKSFTQTINRTDTIKLPEYYKKRLGEKVNIYEIPQCEYDWIKRVGALEKSKSMLDMWNGIMSCAIMYFENKEFLQKNDFFSSKINKDFAYDQAKQEELMELICMQTTAIVFHRLVKSDSADIVKNLLNNLPLYKVVTGNPVDTTKLSRSVGANAYIRIRYKYMNYLRIIQNKKGISNINEITDATIQIKNTEKKWLDYILQSSWNGNNPIHDCLYYGACDSFRCLLEFYFKLKMNNELNKMMLEPNILNESHLDIVRNGRKSCESHASYIIRSSQFEECEQLYNRTTELLHNYVDADSIFNTIEQNDKVEVSADGDNTNVHSLIIRGDIDGMISHINRNKNNLIIIKKTLDIWESTVAIDQTGLLCDYLDDVKFQIKDILEKL